LVTGKGSGGYYLTSSLPCLIIIISSWAGRAACRGGFKSGQQLLTRQTSAAHFRNLLLIHLHHCFHPPTLSLLQPPSSFNLHTALFVVYLSLILCTVLLAAFHSANNILLSFLLIPTLRMKISLALVAAAAGYVSAQLPSYPCAVSGSARNVRVRSP